MDQKVHGSNLISCVNSLGDLQSVSLSQLPRVPCGASTLSSLIEVWKNVVILLATFFHTFYSENLLFSSVLAVEFRLPYVRGGSC